MNHTLQVHKDLKEGKWGREGKLPSFRSLASHYDCSLTVIQQAFKLLDEEGLLRSFQRKGVFWANSDLRANCRLNRIIGVTYLTDCFDVELESLKSEWLNDGWFIAGYNANIHRQDPVKEKAFLLKAREERFSAMVMLATPIEPCNVDLFAQLRLEGIKIAHLIPYRADMTRESFFSADYVAAGRMMAEEAARRGYKYVALLKEGNSPDRDLNYQGVLEGAKESSVTVLSDIDASGWDALRLDDFLAGRSAEEPPFLRGILSLPSGTCVFSQATLLVHQSIQLLAKYGVQGAGNIGMAGLDDLDQYFTLPVSRPCFDRKAQLRAALEYATDSAIKPCELVQRLFAPSFSNRNSF